MVEERLHHGPPEPSRRIALKMYFADTAAFAPRLAVIPRSQNEMHHLAQGILARQGLVESGAAVNILLIKEPGDDKHGHLNRLFGQQLVHRLVLPKGIVGRVVYKGAPEAKLLEPAGCGHGACGAGSQVLIISVATTGPPLLVALARPFLIVNVIDRACLTKGALVDPVVPNPAVHPRGTTHRDF